MDFKLVSATLRIRNMPVQTSSAFILMNSATHSFAHGIAGAEEGKGES